MTRTALLPASLILLAACGEQSPSEGDSAYDDTEVLAAIAELEATVSTQAQTIEALEAELAGVTGGIDVTDLAAQVGDNSNAVDALTVSVNDNADGIEALQAAGYATETWVTDQAFASVSDVETALGDLQVDIDTNAAAVVSNASDISTNTSDLSSLETEVDAFVGLEDLATYLTVDTSDDSVVFTGANVYVQSGSGSTNGTVNGLGNLIVGYDEDDGSDDKSGSHNLIVGMYHSYSEHESIIGGYNNESAGVRHILGGRSNSASADYNVVFGRANEVSTSYSSILGGFTSTIASGQYGMILGGAYNETTQNYTTVVGGYYNEGGGYGATIVGGYENTTSNQNAVVVGGSLNETGGKYSVVTGGYEESSSSSYEVVVP